jgi:hypothetical protein
VDAIAMTDGSRPLKGAVREQACMGSGPVFRYDEAEQRYVRGDATRRFVDRSAGA